MQPMRERTITIKVTDEDLRQAGFETSQISDSDFQKVVNSIGIGLKIAVSNEANKAKRNHWWLSRNNEKE